MSRWLVGSSRSSTDGSLRRSLASSIRICQPLLNSPEGRVQIRIPEAEPEEDLLGPGLDPPALAVLDLCWMRPMSASRLSISGPDSPAAVLAWISMEISSKRAWSCCRSSKAFRVSSRSVRPACPMSSWGRYPTVEKRDLWMTPVSASTSPVTIFISVDFPVPLDPTTAIRSRSPMKREKPSKRTFGPYCLEMFWSESILFVCSVCSVCPVFLVFSLLVVNRENVPHTRSSESDRIQINFCRGRFAAISEFKP